MAPRLPALRAHDLEGDQRLLPSDLPADPSLVLFSLDGRHGAAADSWVEALPQAPSVEISLLPRRRRLLRRPTKRGLARWCWRAYADIDGYLAGLGEYGQAEIVVAVVRRDGEVPMLRRGEPAGDSLEVVREALAID